MDRYVTVLHPTSLYGIKETFGLDALMTASSSLIPAVTYSSG